MKGFKRVIALIAVLCIAITLLPPMQFARAAEVVRRYELDTDGIDVGQNYIIVNTATAGTGNALLFNYGSNSSSRSLNNQSVTIKEADGIKYIESGSSFTNEDNCTFTFSGEASGQVKHGDYAVDLTTSRYVSGDASQALTFTNSGGGAYRISYKSNSWINSRTYYLRYSNSDWARSSTNSTVYLYKQVEYEVGYDVTFDGNGYTEGVLPQNAEKLSSGTQYTIPEPASPLRKDVGEDTWLFLCWNTKPDGSGVEYKPGEKVTLTSDLVLYADWYQQTKYTISMITDLDGVRTDVKDIAGVDKQFFAKLTGGDGTYIPLNKTATGTYSAKVPDNGDYVIYSRVEGGEYEAVHGHRVTIYNQDGATECQHFSVSYDTQGGTWAEGEDPGTTYYHALDEVVATEKTPTLAGNRFLGWKVEETDIQPGQQVTAAIDKKITLVAQWEKTITVTVQIVIDHNADGGENNAQDMHDVAFTLLREENGVNLPVAQQQLTGGKYDEAANTTTYVLTFQDMPQGIYHLACAKESYESTLTASGKANENQTLTANLEYAPENFNLSFDVVVNADTAGEKDLLPNAVNVKVSYWGFNDKQELGWHIITQQEGTNAPVTVTIDKETGKGSGYYPVWKYWSGGNRAYEYRVEVTSFILPDGTIVRATGNGAEFAGSIYDATLAVDANGRVPTNSETYPGVYFDGAKQAGALQVTVEINPYTVTFNAGDGKVSGKDTLVLENQYMYPDLNGYVAVPNEEDLIFAGWADENGNLVMNRVGQLLPGNVTYIARYNKDLTVHGTVEVAATYLQDGHTANINAVDLPAEVMILIRRQVGEQFITVDSQIVPVTYEEGAAYGKGKYDYRFENLPNDGTVYQIHALPVNYTGTYDNGLDGEFAKDEEIVFVEAGADEAQLNVRLEFDPEVYLQNFRIDASQIAEGLRPTGALAQILYRDLGDVHNFQVISQHTVPPYGLETTIDRFGQGAGADEVWNRHVDGAPYEYQLEISRLYGSLKGIYETEGTAYTENSPFTVVYGPPNNYLKEDSTLVATLVPKEYPVYLDLNLQGDTAPVYGMSDYMVDDGSGNARYAYVHTWSFASQFTAYPYREGWVFTGWKEQTQTDKEFIIDNGTVHVGATLAKPVTLVAQWEQLTGTDYTVRHLELNTDKVLHGATVVTSTAEGTRIVAAEAATSIEGYEYAGAFVDGDFVHKSNNPAMTVTNDPTKNVLVIYYLPDASSGYTEQVESNVEINKNAVLQADGTYTITLDTFTKGSPVTTMIRQDTPLDVVLVLDQSGSIYSSGSLENLKDSVGNFIDLVAQHGRENGTDHRIAIVGYASDEFGGYTSLDYPTAGRDGAKWVNTGVFDTHGDFHIYPITGFNYTEYIGSVSPDGTYYTYAHGEYLLLTYHENYRHLITEAQARQAVLEGTAVYGYVDGQFVELTSNSSGLWLYGDKKLYSEKEFFTFHNDVWTHREGLQYREIHAYGTGDAFREVGEHTGIYTRTETRDANPQKSIYKDAMVPVSVGANGSGSVTPGLLNAVQNIGANGSTYVSYGLELANKVLEENPLATGEDRLRIVVVFTDGKPGENTNFDEVEANRAIAQSYIATNTHKARVYTIGLYGNDVVSAESDQDYFMNGLSSNYPNAQSLDDVWQGVTYKTATSGYRLNNGGPYFVQVDGQYYMLTRGSVYENRVYYNTWGYTDDSGNRVVVSKTPVAEGHPMITNGMVNGQTIYKQYGNGYKATTNSGYYTIAENAAALKTHFANVVKDITTNITTEIILDPDTILRDIMNQGLVMTNGTKITVALQEGNYQDDGKILWAEGAQQVVALDLSTGSTSITDTQNNTGVQIHVYNFDAKNPTNPGAADYKPHTVDITGYDFAKWYIGEGNKTGFKMIVTIDRVEARNDVLWGRSTSTNDAKSGLWLPKDEQGNRKLLLAFDQPSTIFVERAFVLDYGKSFDLSNWYFDDEDGQNATPIHIDGNIADGMNYFATPNTGEDLPYGKVSLSGDVVSYSPTTMNWGGYDQFYVFGNTWRKTVLAQDANQNGNLWNRVTVIPANNIYFEDSFETDPEKGIEGFEFSGAWSTVQSGGEADKNTEIPEHLESAPYGDVHGWTDSLGDDTGFSDGSAHMAFASGFDPEQGAHAQFTFTGTGVEVYSRTNKTSGAVLAVLYRQVKDESGNDMTIIQDMLAKDNLAMSGDYYQVPTISFRKLPYGTYTLQLIATQATSEETGLRHEYYIDGVRIHNPLGNTTEYETALVQYAYGLETNAVFTEIRDVLLQYKDFNTQIPDGTDSKMGAVFIDWIKEGQGSGNDTPGIKNYTYEIGTYEELGPKNEGYLKAGQGIVLKVAEGNTYFVGMKSLTGAAVTANVSGIDRADPVPIQIKHTADMYYRVTPDQGYIVIQNGNTEEGAILAITNLRATNPTTTPVDGGVLPVTQQAAVMTMRAFSLRMSQRPTVPETNPNPEDAPIEDVIPDVQQQINANAQLTAVLFEDVRQWLETT